MKIQSNILNLLLFAVGIILFIPFLGSVHLFDWDEINFAECAREMIVSGNYSTVMVNFAPFWEKPPLFIWMQVLSMKVFGINEFAARLPNAICGIATLLVVFNIGKKLFDEKFGLIWALAFAGSLLPHFYFKSGIIDPWFNLFIFLGIYHFILFNNSPNNKILMLSALFIGLGILTKGPVALLIFLLTFAVYFILERKKPNINAKQIINYLVVLFFAGGSWFIYLFIKGQSNVVIEFILYQVRLFTTEDAGHGGPFYYHFLILLIGCFPVSIFAMRGLRKNKTDTPFQKYFKRWMVILFWTVLILFSIVKTKIIHYSSLCWFPLTFLGAYSVYKMMLDDLAWKKWMTYCMVIIAFLIGIALMGLQFIDKYKTEIINSGIIKDPFATENLKADVHWEGWEFLIGLFFLLGILFSIFILKRRNFNFSLIALFIITLITTNVSMMVIVPKVEQYTQGAAIEFYETFKGKEFNIIPYGYKTYADKFYSDNIPLINHPVPSDKLYFVCKIQNVENIQKEHSGLTELYRKNGFVFFEKVSK